MQMGRYHFQILWTLPFQFLQDIFDETTKSTVKTLRGTSVELKLACEQALCLGKYSEEREGKGGGGERACRQTFEAAIPPSCNYPADHLSVRSLSVNQFRA